MIIDARVHHLPVQRMRSDCRRAAAVGKRRRAMGGLDLSLKPPKRLRQAFWSFVNKTDAKIDVPTPVGPVTVDLKNPSDLQRLKDAIRGSRLRLTTRSGGAPDAGSPFQLLDQRVQENVPGGWGTVAAAGLGVLGLLALLRSRPKPIGTR